jgi:hypothetical protein
MKPLAKFLMGALFSGVFTTSALAQQAALLDFIEANRQEGFGPGFIALQEQGILHGEVNSTVVIYGYEIGENRDRSHPQYMAVFDSFTPAYELLAGPVLVGGSGVQQFDQLSIQDKVITLTGAMWITGDRACCPSGTARIEYTCSHGSCMARGK